MPPSFLPSFLQSFSRCSVLQFLQLIGTYNVGHFKTHCNELLTSLMSHSIISSSNSNSQKGKMWNKPRLFQVPRTSFTQSPAFGCEGAIHITAMSSAFTTHITCHIHTIAMSHMCDDKCWACCQVFSMLQVTIQQLIPIYKWEILFLCNMLHAMHSMAFSQMS